MRLDALLRLAFAPATAHALTLPHTGNSPAHSSKGRRSQCPKTSLPLLVSQWFQVLFHSPRRGSFHLSLTVLVHYRSSSVFRLGRWTAQFPTELACSVVLRIPALLPQLTCTGLSPSSVGLPRAVPLHLGFACRVLQPRCTRTPVWPLPLSLATTRRIFSFPRAT